MVAPPLFPIPTHLSGSFLLCSHITPFPISPCTLGRCPTHHLLPPGLDLRSQNRSHMQSSGRSVIPKPRPLIRPHQSEWPRISLEPNQKLRNCADTFFALLSFRRPPDPACCWRLLIGRFELQRSNWSNVSGGGGEQNFEQVAYWPSRRRSTSLFA